MYIEKKDEANFPKIQEIQGLLNKWDRGVRVMKNGFYLFQPTISPLHLSLDIPMLSDYNQFNFVYQPIIDEECLMPL